MRLLLVICNLWQFKSWAEKEKQLILIALSGQNTSLTDKPKKARMSLISPAKLVYIGEVYILYTQSVADYHALHFESFRE